MRDLATPRALALARALLRAPDALRRAFADVAGVLVHRDLHPGNVWLPPAGPPILFDWEAVCAGPPIFDATLLAQYLAIRQLRVPLRAAEVGFFSTARRPGPELERAYLDALDAASGGAAPRDRGGLGGERRRSCGRRSTGWAGARRSSSSALPRPRSACARWPLVGALGGLGDRPALYAAWRAMFADFEIRAESGCCASRRSRTRRARAGPCAPSTSAPSMSAVFDGPATNVKWWCASAPSGSAASAACISGTIARVSTSSTSRSQITGSARGRASRPSRPTAPFSATASAPHRIAIATSASACGSPSARNRQPRARAQAQQRGVARQHAPVAAPTRDTARRRAPRARRRERAERLAARGRELARELREVGAPVRGHEGVRRGAPRDSPRQRTRARMRSRALTALPSGRARSEARAEARAGVRPAARARAATRPPGSRRSAAPSERPDSARAARANSAVRERSREDRSGQPSEPPRPAVAQRLSCRATPRAGRAGRSSPGTRRCSCRTSVDANGSRAASVPAASAGASTDPIGPGSAQPYAWPPARRYTGQVFRHAPQRMQASAERWRGSARSRVRPLSTSTMWSSAPGAAR